MTRQEVAKRLHSIIGWKTYSERGLNTYIEVSLPKKQVDLLVSQATEYFACATRGYLKEFRNAKFMLARNEVEALEREFEFKFSVRPADVPRQVIAVRPVSLA